MYKAISDEIWVLGQIVMRGNRIIMPGSLWKQTLSLAHEGHQGIVRSRNHGYEKGMVAKHEQTGGTTGQELATNAN